LVIGGKTEGFKMPDAFGEDSNFALASSRMFLVKVPVIICLMFGAVQAKLIKVMVINIARAIDQSRHPVPQAISKIFQYFFHMRDDDHKDGWYRWLKKKKNFIPLVSRFSLTMILYYFKNDILPEHFEQQDAGDLLGVAALMWLWGFIRYLPNAMHHQLVSKYATIKRSDENANKNANAGIVERAYNRIAENRIVASGSKWITENRGSKWIAANRVESSLMLFGVFLFSFYGFATFGASDLTIWNALWMDNAELLFVEPLYVAFWFWILSFGLTLAKNVGSYFANAKYPPRFQK
jgi:hypothetical protein